MSLRKRIKRVWLWIRFGKIRVEVRDYIDVGAGATGIVCEKAYIGRFNRIVGYWAYGYFDPAFPYQGENENAH